MLIYKKMKNEKSKMKNEKSKMKNEKSDDYVYLNKTFNSYGIARAEIIDLIDLKNYN